MKITVFLPMIISILILFPCLQADCAAIDTDKGRPAMEEKIWKLEEAYFTNLYNADHDGTLALVHSQFLGWPDMAAKPLDWQGSADFMKKAFSKPSPCTLTFEREGISVVDNAALTQYIIHASCSDTTGTVKRQSSRITHTWIKEGRDWKLLGGMSMTIVK
ncbi:MAG TPA: nuclear transport factor 2 family protein [Syntrophorhabdaceae bacterium]|nr:nuclear transport factor 2 family protein [Syntrophorhabdaceae bacterium]